MQTMIVPSSAKPVHVAQVVDAVRHGNYAAFFELYSAAPRMVPYLMDAVAARVRCSEVHDTTQHIIALEEFYDKRRCIHTNASAPSVLRRSRGLAAITQAYMPSVPVKFVAFNLGLDSEQEVRQINSA